jgi:hypothetical protein
MKHVTVIVHDAQKNLSTIVGIHEVFSKANEYWKRQGRKEVLKFELAGLSKKVEFDGGLFLVKPQVTISSISKTERIKRPRNQTKF